MVPVLLALFSKVTGAFNTANFAFYTLHAGLFAGYLIIAFQIWSYGTLRTVSQLYQLFYYLACKSWGAFKAANFAFITLCAQHHERYTAFQT